MALDEHRLDELLEESRDTHADAMRSTTDLLDEFVETGLERKATDGASQDEHLAFAERRTANLRRNLAGAGAAAGIGAAMLALSETASFASTATDIQILQTNQSIENLAIATYTIALKLPFIGGPSANGVVRAFVKETLAQHKEHEAAFTAATRRLGGTPQTKPDPVLLQVVKRAEPTLKSAAAVVSLALELEDGAAQTYVATTGALGNVNARKVTASIMGVEAQHVAILRAVQALLGAGDGALVALPPSPLSALPAVAGSVGFPAAFYPTSGARPKTEGAMR